MALKDTWVEKKDGVDINSADDINQVARAVIDLENKPDPAAKIDIVQETGDSTVSVMSQKATTIEIDALKTDITDLKDALIGVSDLIGGDA